MAKKGRWVVEAVCISPRKGMVKKEIEELVFEKDWGAAGDAHADTWHRQIPILAGKNIDAIRKQMPHLKHGVFAENIVARGIDLKSPAVDDCLKIGSQVILEVTQIDKECHNEGCAIKKATGDCIMPREGIFCRVRTAGKVRAGDRICSSAPVTPAHAEYF